MVEITWTTHFDWPKSRLKGKFEISKLRLFVFAFRMTLEAIMTNITWLKIVTLTMGTDLLKDVR